MNGADVSDTPELESSSGEIAIEAEHVAALRALHDRETYGVRIGNRSRREVRDPALRCQMILLCLEMQSHARACIDAVERPPRCLEPGAEQGEPVDFRDHEIRRDERDAPPDGLAKRPIRLGVMLIAPAA